MMCLPALVFGAEIEGSGMLKVRWEHNSFVTGFTRQLHTQVPGVEGYKSEFEVLRQDVLLCKRREALDCVTERPGVADLVPGEGRQASCRRSMSAASSENMLSLGTLTAQGGNRRVHGFH